MKKKRLTVVALHLQEDRLRKVHKDLLQLWASLLQSPAKASLPHLPAFYINPAQHILRHQCSAISLTGSSLRARLVVLATSNRNLTMVTASRLVKEAARTSSYRAITQTSSTAIGSTSNSPRLSVSSSVSRS